MSFRLSLNLSMSFHPSVNLNMSFCLSLNLNMSFRPSISPSLNLVCEISHQLFFRFWPTYIWRLELPHVHMLEERCIFLDPNKWDFLFYCFILKLDLNVKQFLNFKNCCNTFLVTYVRSLLCKTYYLRKNPLLLKKDMTSFFYNKKKTIVCHTGNHSTCNKYSFTKQHVTWHAFSIVLNAFLWLQNLISMHMQ